MNLQQHKITKLSDDVFNEEHPNGINTGYTQTGVVVAPPKVGECFYIGSLQTTRVTSIIDESIFKTKNSTYKLEDADPIELGEP